jgi:hypothetical protein
MARRFFTKVDIDPRNPEARGICDRCGRQFTLSTLRWQFQYTPGGLKNLKILVCKTCRDDPSLFLKALFLPPDPEPVFNARPEFYAIDEAGSYPPAPNPTRGAIFLLGCAPLGGAPLGL